MILISKEYSIATIFTFKVIAQHKLGNIYKNNAKKRVIKKVKVTNSKLEVLLKTRFGIDYSPKNVGLGLKFTNKIIKGEKFRRSPLVSGFRTLGLVQ